MQQDDGEAGVGSAMAREDERVREVEVRDLEAERAGRVFPCVQAGGQYRGCIGYEACQVLCWSPRPRDREALVRVETIIERVPCRTCVYAREVRRAVAVVGGRQVPLMECRLGFWHGRTTVSDFVVGKVPLNVGLPCPGYLEAVYVASAVEQLRQSARLRKQHAGRQETEEEEPEMSELERLLQGEQAPRALPEDARRIENRRRLREFLRVTPRAEEGNRLTLLGPTEAAPAVVVTRAQLTAAIERLRPATRQIIRLTLEERRTQADARAYLRGIGSRTLERYQAAGLDALVEAAEEHA